MWALGVHTFYPVSSGCRTQDAAGDLRPTSQAAADIDLGFVLRRFLLRFGSEFT